MFIALPLPARSAAAMASPALILAPSKAWISSLLALADASDVPASRSPAQAIMVGRILGDLGDIVSFLFLLRVASAVSVGRWPPKHKRFTSRAFNVRSAAVPHPLQAQAV